MGAGSGAFDLTAGQIISGAEELREPHVCDSSSLNPVARMAMSLMTLSKASAFQSDK